MRNLSFIYFLVFFTISIGAHSQSNTSDNLFKIYNPLGIHSILRYDHYNKSGSFFHVEGSAHSAVKPVYYDHYPFNTHLLYLKAGYEKALSEMFYLGGSGQFEKDIYDSFLNLRANVSHRGKLKSIYFIKELSVEHINNISPSHANQPNIGSLSLAGALVKPFIIREEKNLYIMLSLKPYKYFYWDGNSSAFATRRINSTKLRLDLTYMLTKNIYIGVFALRETVYYYRQGTFDNSGSQVVPEGKVNRVSPTVGFHLNYIFKPEGVTVLPHLPLR